MTASKSQAEKIQLQALDRSISGLKVTIENSQAAKLQVEEALASNPGNSDLERTAAAFDYKIREMQSQVMAQEAEQVALLRIYANSISDEDLNIKSTTKAANQPPIVAEIITRWVTKPDLVDMVIDSRAERFARDFTKRGPWRAKVFYWSDTAKSCWPAIVSLGRWILAGELFRRWMGS